jgi:hypothetical protein
MSATRTARVEEEIALRRKQEAEEAERRKDPAHLAERVKKQAGVGGMAPGFATAQLGASVAAAAAANSDGKHKLHVKDVVRTADAYH